MDLAVELGGTQTQLGISNITLKWLPKAQFRFRLLTFLISLFWMKFTGKGQVVLLSCDFFFFLEGVLKLILNPKSLSGASERHLHKYKIMPPVMMLKYGTIVFMEHMNYRKTLLFPSIYFHPNSFPEAPV